MSDLTHIGPDGRARMVDVTDKDSTHRVAVAQGRLKVSPETFRLAVSRDTKKGDPLAISELAGIMGSKKTSDLIPLCHPLPITGVTVDIEPEETASALNVTARVKTTGKTGVEMEALTAVSVACLTLYDMLKAIDKSMVIESIELVEKSGGRSGDFRKADK
ncbi:MAG: cyclic pyranopterin monophosphate synthase MoaC [Ponticaulis sp.]|nr:cyclic pyranopterin monophosphate synthase MoaC [Ponticaulis sp.]